jgi:hypothetical protein
VAAARFVQDGRPPQQRSARRASARLSAYESRFTGARALALLVEAGLACAAGTREALALVSQALMACEKVDLRLQAQVAKARLAELAGGERGRHLEKEADAFFVDNEVVNPAALRRQLAPGL